VNDFTPKLGITDREQLQKAINYLGDRGLIILASIDIFGGISAGITVEGSVFVEKGGETGIIKQYKKTPRTIIPPPPKPPLPAVGLEKTRTTDDGGKGFFFARRAVEAILEDIKEILEMDDTVAVEAKKDLLSDIATLKIQMKRSVKNQQIFNVILGNLSNISSIAPLLTGLNCIIETYFRKKPGQMSE
jgi:hypothetical protein